MGERLPGERLHRVLLQLHPRRFRQRFGGASDRLFGEWVGAGETDSERRQRGRRAAGEAFATLLGAWSEELTRRFRGLGRAVGSGFAVVERGSRAAWRGACSRPLQTMTVVATVAIAVGANTAVLSVGRTLLLRPLPYEDADRLVRVEGGPVVRRDGDSLRLSEEFATLPGLVRTTHFVPRGSANLVGAGETTRVSLAQVAPGFFEVAGFSMALGRSILDRDAGEPVAVLGHALWRQAFAADPEILGRTVRLNERAYTIVGVAPPEVDFPAEAALWLPLPFVRDFYGNAFGADALARLERGADVRALNELLATRFASTEASERSAGELPPPRLVPLRGFLLRDVREPMVTLAAAAGLVLLLGGLNLAGIWSSQIAERVDELRLRRALGASRARILADLVTENVVVAAAGGLAAVPVARGMVAALGARLPASIPGREAIFDATFTVPAAIGLSLAAGVAFGAIAALGASQLERDATRRAGDGRSSRRLQTALVVAQGALALVLVAGASLMVRSFQELAAAPLGFDPEGTLTFRVRLPDADAAPASAQAYARELESRLASLPGVVAVGLADLPPLSFEIGYTVQLRRRGDHEQEPTFAMTVRANHAYFAAAGIPVREGEPFTPEIEEAPGLIVDARVAAELFPGSAATGGEVEVQETVAGQPVWRRETIRAVVGRVHAFGARASAYPAIYSDLSHHPSPTLGAIVRAQGNPSRLAESVRASALAVSPTAAPHDLRSLRSLAASLIDTDRALAVVGTAFSSIALALAALGLYGMTARQVTGRRREYGVRLALGATTRQLVGGAVRRGLGLGLAAILLGLPGALAGAGALRSRLFGVEPFDPLIFAWGAALLLAIVVLAAWVPARRISRVDPREALAA